MKAIMMNELEIARKVIEEFELVHGKGESRGACHTIANRIALRLTDCKVVSGYIRMRQGDAQHWWVELYDGIIIDPLAEMWMDKPFRHITINKANELWGTNELSKLYSESIKELEQKGEESEK